MTDCCCSNQVPDADRWEALADDLTARLRSADGRDIMTSSIVTTKERTDLSELVDYAEGAIVSRTLAESPSRTVTLFAFDAGQALSEHSAPFNAFVQVLDGEAEITIGGTPNRATVDSVVLMPADVPHAVRAVTRFKMLLVMIRSEPE
jgi:quercetin dioxygenase-like cupin family protein